MSYFNDHSNYQRRKHVWNFYTIPFWGSQTNPKWPFPPKNPISFLKLSIKKNKITAQLPSAKANHLYLSSFVFLTKKKISQKHFSATSPCLKKIFLERLWKGFANIIELLKMRLYTNWPFFYANWPFFSSHENSLLETETNEKSNTKTENFQNSFDRFTFPVGKNLMCKH